MSSQFSMQVRAGRYNPLVKGSSTLWVDAQDPGAVLRSGSTLTAVRNKVSGVPFNTGTLPTFSETGINNLPSLSFNGTTQSIRGTETAVWSAMAGPVPFTLFYVAYPTATAGVTFVCFGSTSSGSNREFRTAGVTSRMTMIGQDDAATPFQAGPATPSITAAPHIFEWWGTGQVASFRLDGGSPDPNLYPDTIGTMTLNRFTLGARDNVGALTNFLTGFMGEVLSYKTELTSLQRLQTRLYLSEKWKIPVT